jgi:ACT domain
METYVLRLWLPDRPGALGAVASRIGAVKGDVVGIDILETGRGQAVDEVVVELPDATLLDLLVAEVRQVDGVKVEEVRPAGSGGHDPRLDALETAALLVGAPDRTSLLDAVCTHAGRALGARWVAVLGLDDHEVRAAGPGAPTGGWLSAFLHGARSASALSGVDGGGGDVAWAPLPGAALALVVGRDRTPWRARERRQIAALARIVDSRYRELARAESRKRHPSLG